jgi:aminoglycoside phosphotransferase (APT) family kinase protein
MAHDLSPARPGVPDLGHVQRRAGAALAPVWPGCQVRDLRPLPGGASSLTFVAELAGAPQARVVVKMAPPGLPPLSNRDVLRQARVLQALAAAPEVAVPAVHATDAGTPPHVPPLFVMDYVDGESYEPLLPEHGGRLDPPPAGQVATRTGEAIRMLAALHRQDASALGLGDEPVTSLAGECAKWARALATCELTASETALERECRRRLERDWPEPAGSAILHGDWRLGNMQCRGGDVRAVIDWEIWSVGDPRTDLAWMMMWSSAENPSVSARTGFAIQPSRQLSWYEEAAGLPVADLDWIGALVRYKWAAITALLAKNARKRGESGPHIDRLDATVGATLDWALAFLP